MIINRRTRSSTPLHPNSRIEEDQNMSSGDESDNEDLIDTSSDSDWSDTAGSFKLCSPLVKLISSHTERLEETDVPTSNRALLAYYSRVTRRYTARQLGEPSMWIGSPFTLTRVFIRCAIPYYPLIIQQPLSGPLASLSS